MHGLLLLEDPSSTARVMLTLWKREQTRQSDAEPVTRTGRAAPVGSDACGNLVP